MNLIILYGPPASGKLTVAQELIPLLEYKLFHNHLTIELAKEIFPEYSDVRTELVSKLRLDVFEAAAAAGINMIFTFVYASKVDDDFLNRVCAIVESHQGSVYFVQLVPDDLTLEQRITGESRLTYSKIKQLPILQNLMEKYDLRTPYPHPSTLSIDNSTIPASEVAQRVISHFNL